MDIYVKLLTGEVLPLTVTSMREAQSAVASHLSTDQTVVLFPLDADAAESASGDVDAVESASNDSDAVESASGDADAVESASNDALEPLLVHGGHYGAVVRDPMRLFSSISIARTYADSIDDFVSYHVRLYQTGDSHYSEIPVYYEVDTMLFHHRTYVICTPEEREALCDWYSSSSIADIVLMYDLPIPWYERARFAQLVEAELFRMEIGGDEDVDEDVDVEEEEEEDSEEEEEEEEDSEEDSEEEDSEVDSDVISDLDAEVDSDNEVIYMYGARPRPQG